MTAMITAEAIKKTDYDYNLYNFYRYALKYNLGKHENDIRKAIKEERVSGSLHGGVWHDIGTPQRLEAVNGL